MRLNPVTLIDGYKLDHRRQYPLGTQRVQANWTARGSRIPGVTKVVNYQARQYFFKEYLAEQMGRFFNDPKDKAINRFARRVSGYVGPDAAAQIGTDHIANLWSLGHLPLEFRGMPEGSLIPLRLPLTIIENTHDDFFWLTNYMETLMSTVMWMPLTSATLAARFRVMLGRWAGRTGTAGAFVPWQGHDFSMRGMGGVEAAVLSGSGHLTSFTGTDTIPAIDFIEDYYGMGLPEDYVIGGSVAATEHSVMSAGGMEHEQDTLDRLLDLYPSGILSVVSDTWDLWRLITEYLPALKSKVMERNGKLVIRPDSGDPVKIVCGDPDALPGTPEHAGVIRLLWEVFGGTVNAQGYKELDPHIGSIYGDAITFERGNEICARLEAQGFASSVIVFGVGSFSYQYVTRDTFGLAMKATWVRVNGEGRNIFKKPRTDNGEKFSATGRLAVVRDTATQQLVLANSDEVPAVANLMVPLWRNGIVLVEENWMAIRNRLSVALALDMVGVSAV